MRASRLSCRQRSATRSSDMSGATVTTTTGPAARDGFVALDACHRETVQQLEVLAALIKRLDEHGADAEARAMAAGVVKFFSTTARCHHEDEERHVFPRVVVSSDPEIVHTVLRLQ